jgi:rapamycin-insensitive companion of mTOR
VCFLGICLPRNILEFFPDDQQNGTYVSRYIHDIETLESNNLSISSILAKNQQYPTDNAGESLGNVPDESTVSSLSDLSGGNKKTKRRPVISTSSSTAIPTEQNMNVNVIENDNQSNMIRSISSGGGTKRHNKDECLMCCRNKIITKVVDTSLIIQESKEVTVTTNGKTRDSSDVSFYSPESVISDDSANMPDRISNIILRNFQKMANPILFKTCRKILMELRQKYPQSFQDICLYSEVCKYMGICNYRMTVRRFIQEIFLDLNYDVFNNDIDLILNVARQRLADQKLLDTSKTFPSTSSSSSSTSSPQSNTNSQILNVSNTQNYHTTPSASTASLTSSQAISLSHKLHSIKSPLLASVHESSIENLIDPPKSTKDEVDSVNNKNNLKSTGYNNNNSNNKSSPGSSQKVTAEIHGYRQKKDTDSAGSEIIQPIRRRRFNTLELDLSCTVNKFPIKHRSQQATAATSTADGRPNSISTAPIIKDGEQSFITKNFSTSDHSFEYTRSITSPISPLAPLYPLYCEQRLLQSSRSEATLSKSNNISNNNNNNEDTHNNISDDGREKRDHKKTNQ